MRCSSGRWSRSSRCTSPARSSTCWSTGTGAFGGCGSRRGDSGKRRVSDDPTTKELRPVPWTCPNCATAVTTPFCPGCGERPIVAADLSLRGIAVQLAKVIGGVDGRVLRSLRALLRHPGNLTRAYAEGRRKPLIGPFQLFLLTNVAFFAVQ